jgi:uracil-DNA glycosylase
MSRPPVAKVKSKSLAKIANKDGKQQSILSFFTSPTSNGKLGQTKNTTSDSQEQNIAPDTDVEVTTPTTPPSKRVKLSESQSVNNVDPEAGSLTPEQKDLVAKKRVEAKLKRMSSSLPLLDPAMGITWFTALEDEFRKDYFQKLNDFIISARSRATIYPPPANVWEWTKHSAIQDVKVVILGQDPYHGPNQAHGLCFSVKKEVRSPPSLLNMYKELQDDIPGFKTPNHGCLIGWAEQGVLLLNAVLTVEANKANSHKDQGWERITDAVISWISKNLKSVVFLLWGSYAQKKAAIVDRTKHHLLQCPHPSPLSAHRGFLGCKQFSATNALLMESGRTPIDWKYLP